VRCINWDNPAESKLLRAAQSAHGTAQAAVFTDRQVPQFRRLMEWAYRITQKPMPTEVPDQPILASFEEPVQRPATTKPSRSRVRVTEPQALQPSKNAANAPATQTPAPASDPFDPAAFNQKAASPAAAAQDRYPAPHGIPGPATMLTPAAKALQGD